MIRAGKSIAAAVLGCAFSALGFDSPPAPAVEEILARMASADQVRRAAFAGYTSTRAYTIEVPRLHMRATMRVEITADAAGRKSFRVLERSGPSTVHKMVFRRMLDTEMRASAQPEATRVSAENYSVRLLESRVEEGRPCFVLEAVPKSANPLLFRGLVWVDAAEYAVVRIQGSPAQNPSFWLRKTSFEHRYAKYGRFWLPASNRSETEVRMAGTSTMSIDYGDYRLEAGGETQKAEIPSSRPPAH